MANTQANELKRILKNKDEELAQVKHSNNELRSNTDARDILREKKELEFKLQELETRGEFEKSKTSKDYDHLKKDSSSLISYILGLEFILDEEFSKLFKNQSHSNEFEQARKHLEYQKDAVSANFDKLETKIKSQSKQIEDYRIYILELESNKENSEEYKIEANKWKQNYERLTITLKNTQGSDTKDMDNILKDYQKLQNTLEESRAEKDEVLKVVESKEKDIKDLQSIILNYEKEIKGLKGEIDHLKSEANTESKEVNVQNSTLLLKLEKELSRLESENTDLKLKLDNSKQNCEKLNEKYQLSVEKSLKLDQYEHLMNKLQNENNSLQDQVTILKKTNSEQKKILNSNESAEVMSNLKSLKSTIQRKDNEIKECNAKIQVLENLLDEARVEMGNGDTESEKSEKSTLNDALEILDSIISKPLGISSTNKGQDFNAILKRAQLIKEQTEEPILNKMIEFMKEYLPSTFSEQSQKCQKPNELKQLFLDTLNILKEQNRVVYDPNSNILDISTDSKSLRRPYGYKDAYIDIVYILDQFTDTYKSIRDFSFDKNLEETVRELKEKHNQDIIANSNEYIEKIQEERKSIVEQLTIEKDTEIKICEERVAKEYQIQHKQMFEEFDKLKKEFTEQSKKYQEVSEEENEKRRKDIEKQKEKYETTYQEKLQKKVNHLEGMFNNRKKELEDEFNLKVQRLEYEMNDKAESQDNKNKAELESLIDKHENQAQEKIKRIESECDGKIQEFEEQISQKNTEMKKLKFEHEKKLKEHKKTMDRELKFKSENLEREFKSKLDRELKRQNENIEDLEVKIKDLNQKVLDEKKKHRELIKSNNEKHKAEIKNIKNNHENELIRKKIENEKEIKKARRDLETDLENFKKENEVQLAEKLLTQKKELNSSYTQKLKLEKSKHEKALIEKETEMNQKFNEKEIENLKKHDEEIQVMKENITQHHEKLMNATIDNIKEEFQEKCKEEFTENLQCETERIRKEYETLNQNLKVKLQEVNDTQSVATIENLNLDLVAREEESVQTDEYLFPIHASEMKRIQKPNTPFDYEQRNNQSAQKDEDSDEEVEENPRLPPTARSMISAKSEKEMADVMHARNRQEMDTLQKRYELRITELLEGHMSEIQETKQVTTLITIKKLEKIFILELEKMCQALM